MAMRFWSTGMHGLSLATFPTVKPSCQRHCHFPIAKASLSIQATSNGFPLVSEEPTPVVIKKERLTRQERAAVVGSFVQKYMEAHEGAFPNVTTVLKNTGGSRIVVKDILSDLENRYAEATSTHNLTDSTSTADVPTKGDAVQALDNADEGEDEAGAISELEDSTHNLTDSTSTADVPTKGDAVQALDNADDGEDEAGAISELEDEDEYEDEDEDEYEDEDEDEDDFINSGYESEGENEGREEEELEESEISGFRTSGKQEAERERMPFNNGGTTRSGQGESETHSKLSSRLRGMGMSSSPQQPSSEVQGSSKRFRPAGLAGSYLPRQDFTESESNKENGRVPEWQSLNYSNAVENGLRNGTHRGRNGDVSRTSRKERHGLFVRYLSCQATSADLREAFEDCGGIVRAYAIKARPNVKYTYGFVDFKTVEALEKALGKGRVYIKGSRILTEPSTTLPRKSADDGQHSNAETVESDTLQTSKKVVDTRLNSSDVKEVRDSGYKVAVMGIPMNIPLSEVQAALSKYGEIVLSDMKQENIGTYSANLEFQGIDAQDKALSAKSVRLNGSYYSIKRANPFKTSVVRLSNVGAEVDADRIGATCELFGRVKEVAARCDGSVDVYFQSTEVENIPKILARLNEVTMDGQQWQALPSSCLDFDSDDSILQTMDGREWLQLESERMLSKVESALKKLVVDVEDLQELVKANKYHMWSGENGSD